MFFKVRIARGSPKSKFASRCNPSILQQTAGLAHPQLALRPGSWPNRTPLRLDDWPEQLSTLVLARRPQQSIPDITCPAPRCQCRRDMSNQSYHTENIAACNQLLSWKIKKQWETANEDTCKLGNHNPMHVLTQLISQLLSQRTPLPSKRLMENMSPRFSSRS